jgi:hypothetical protein
MSSKKPRVNFARIRDNRLKQQQEADAPPPLPKDASDLYADSGPPDVPVSQPIKSQPVAEPASSPQRPEPSIAPAPRNRSKPSGKRAWMRVICQTGLKPVSQTQSFR